MRSKYKRLKRLNDVSFRRLTGVSRETFAKMLSVLRIAKKQIKVRGGPKDKLSEV